MSEIQVHGQLTQVDENGDVTVMLPHTTTDDITGVLSIENGGTGVTTKEDILSEIIGVLPIENGGTGTSIKEDIYKNFAITTVEDKFTSLKDYRVPGWYYFKWGMLRSTEQPEYILGDETSDDDNLNNAGYLYVVSGSSAYVNQIWFSYQMDKIYRRMYNAGVWSDWVKFSVDPDKLSNTPKIYYATCITNSDESEKIVETTDGNFVEEDGAFVIISFSNTNTAKEPKLNIDSSGAKNIIYRNTIMTESIPSTSSAADYYKYLVQGLYMFLIHDDMYELVGYMYDNHHIMKGSDSTVDGESGLVPAPAAGKNTAFLRGDATWVDSIPIASGGTGATTSQQALQNLTFHSPTAPDTDLDDYKGTEYLGYWYFGIDYLPTNAPVNNTTGYLVVIRGGGSLCKQIWLTQGTTSNHQDIYVRTYSNNAWESWVKIINGKDTISVANGGTGAPTNGKAYENLAMNFVNTTGTSMNGYTTPGWYYLSGAYIPSDAPVATASYLYVYSCISSTLNQLWFKKDMTKIYNRIYTDESWGNWNELKFTDTTYSAATTSTAGLMSAADKTSLNNLTSRIAGYGVTSGTNSIYTINISGVTLTHGTVIFVRFNAANAANATLNVNNLGAKPIYYKDAAITDNIIPAQTVVALVYDNARVDTGTWRLIYSYDSNTTDIPFGQKTGTTLGENSLAIGSNNEASGSYSYAFGYNNVVNTNNSAVFGKVNEVKSNYSIDAVFAMGIGLVANTSGSFVCGEYNTPPSVSSSGHMGTDSVFIVGGGTGDDTSSRSNAFRVTRAGEVYGASNYNSSGADYAEFIKPWADGNPENEDRVGYMVTIKDGYLYKANEGDYIIGITSGNPSIIGNSDEDYYWKYERDKFNRLVYEEIEMNDTDGNVIKVQRPKVSETYDSSLQDTYISRAKRPEWSYVGMRGIVAVRDDGTSIPGGFCKCGSDGIATQAESQGFNTYYVIERIDENIISVEIK